MSSTDEVIIKRALEKNEKSGNAKSKSYSRRKNNNKSTKISMKIKLTAIFLFFFSIILFLALISYTSRDEAYTQMPVTDLFGLVFGDEIVLAKAAAVHNWLGLIGAFLADFLYNSTIGFTILFLPYFVLIFAKNLFYGITFDRELIRRFIVYIIIATLFASIMGTFQNIFESLPKEWAGAIGIFISSVFSSLIGTIGAALLFIALIVITVALGTDIEVEQYFHKMMKLVDLMNEKGAQATEKIKEKINDREAKVNLKNKLEVDADDDYEEDEDVDGIKQVSSQTPQTVYSGPADTEEPARIIRRNTDILFNKPFKNPKGPAQQPAKSAYEEINDDKEEELNPFVYNDEKEEIKEKPEAKPLIKKTYQKPVESKKIEDDDIDINFEADDIETLNEDDDFEYSGSAPRKPLVVTLNANSDELVDDDDDENMIRSPLGVHIHDEEIFYKSPTIDLLEPDSEEYDINEDELKMNAQILQEKLETFKIFIDNLSVTPGPVVTQYEFVPAPGIKISKIESLADDLAMALKAQGIRIIAPIPGKGTVGVEIPNSTRALVRFSSLLNSPKFLKSNYELPLALGKTISGEVYVTDLAKLPHLLIGGSTGSGKSVGINTLLGSLLYFKHPKDLKIILVDPKKVELNQYSALKDHYLAKAPEVAENIITNPADAVITLKSLVLEMEERYDILAAVGQRNIMDYNKKVNEGKFLNDKKMDHRPMPYIVVIIDELADLMITASKEIEEPIIRLAQMARAVGIHLVLATQRPSVDVITGIIKANFPARIAYSVTSAINSRTILDFTGAEKLLGYGDMLFHNPTLSKPVRIQNSFISTDEVEKICDHIRQQKGYSQPYILPSLNEKDGGSDDSNWDISDRDPLFGKRLPVL